MANNQWINRYERAAREFDTTGPDERRAEAFRAAKFRVEAYVAYLEEQRRKLEAEAERITTDLLSRIKAM